MSVIFIILLGTTIFLLVLHTTTTRNHINRRKKNSSGSRYQILRRYGVFFSFERVSAEIVRGVSSRYFCCY